MTHGKPKAFTVSIGEALVLILLGLTVPARAGTWSPLAHTAPQAINLMLLLPDGTVMGARNNGSTIGSGWYRLTPAANGSYINGTWTTLASMHDTRLYYSAQVLMDGRVFVAGGEYGTGTARAEVYDPQTNVWTQINPPTSLLDPSQPSPGHGSTTQKFYDSNSEILPNGNVLVAPVLPKVSGQPLIYNPTTNTWSAGPNYVRGVYQDEASWVKLPDDSILTMDPFGSWTNGGTNPSERYIPSSNTWVNDGLVPNTLYDQFGFELGAGILLPNGKAFMLGSTGQTALYTPSGTTSPGTWVAGPVIPGSKGTPDAPAAMMATGKVLCAVSPVPTSANHFPSPTTFYEYDYVSNAFTSVNAPTGASLNSSTYTQCMLDLPDGNVLFSNMGTQLYVYQPTGTPVASGKPVINSITPNGDGSYHMTGTGLTGISEGAAYGDDLQMSSNYPLVRMSDGSGNVYYARTYNWSSTGVQTGSQIITTEFRPSASMPAGTYSLVVVANGIASDPVTFPPTCNLSLAAINDDSVSCGLTFTSATPSANNPNGSVTWSLGAGAPAGMTINPSNGVVSWSAPTTSGSPYSVTTIATDNCTNSSRTWSLTVNPNPPTINPIADANTACGVPYSSGAPSVTGGAAPLTWALLIGPPGMAIDPSTGIVTWLSPFQSTQQITVQASSANGCGVSTPISWNLTVDPNAPTINPIGDAFAVCGQSYSSPAPSVTGGATPLTWSLNPGPAGMTIDPSTGVVSWPNPIATGSPFLISVQADSAGGCGTSAPQTWQLGVVVGDFNSDGLVTETDVDGFANNLLLDVPICAGDVNGDGLVDGNDIAAFNLALGL